MVPLTCTWSKVQPLVNDLSNCVFISNFFNSKRHPFCNAFSSWFLFFGKQLLQMFMTSCKPWTRFKFVSFLLLPFPFWLRHHLQLLQGSNPAAFSTKLNNSLSADTLKIKMILNAKNLKCKWKIMIVFAKELADIYLGEFSFFIGFDFFYHCLLILEMRFSVLTLCSYISNFTL